MDAAITTFIYYGISWFLSIGALLWFLNFLTRSFLISYFKVKGSRGKKVLIRAEDIIGKYWTIGYVTPDKTFRWKARDKSEKQSTELDSIKAGFYQSMTVTCIDINDSKDVVLVYPGNGDIEYTPLTTSDTADAMLKLHATKPSLGIDKQMVMIILLIVVIIAVGAVGFLEYQNSTMLKYLIQHQANQSIVTIGGGF